jgi:hypothetical protein
MAFRRRRSSEVPDDGRIQVSTYSGRPVVDPPGEVLRDLVLAIARDPDELVVVARVADPDSTYVQAMQLPDGRCVVEVRDGSEDAHAHAYVADVHAVHQVVAAWASGDPAWRGAVDWQDGYP